MFSKLSHVLTETDHGRTIETPVSRLKSPTVTSATGGPFVQSNIKISSFHDSKLLATVNVSVLNIGSMTNRAFEKMLQEANIKSIRM